MPGALVIVCEMIEQTLATLLRARSAALISAFVLAGCSGGGQTPSDVEIAPPPPTSGGWSQVSVADTFDAIRAAEIADAPRFRNVDANMIDGYAESSHPYELARLQWALSGGWSGVGQLVAVVDDGFRTSHQEFVGTEITTFGEVGVADGSDHGTHVAALITGSDQAGSIMGFAPNSDLHLTSYLRSPTSSDIDLGKLTDATHDAASLGAVAQNNSWGVLTREPDGSRELMLSDVRMHMTETGQTVSEAYQALVGGTANRWNGYFEALDAFQSEGVIVWAMSNDETLTENDASSALPRLVPELREAWIAVGNGEFSVTDDHEISAARRLSAPCGEMATSCIFADGTTTSASADRDTSYASGTGTSFAAPQVSAAVAIVAQAFPSLSPEEWTKRLLASAYSEFNGFGADGTHDFGNGVVKAFSHEWGMGVLDVAAALSPIDGVSLVNGRTLSSASRSEVETNVLNAGIATGDAPRSLLSNVEVAVFDSLDTPFMMPAEAFIQTSEPVLSRSNVLPDVGSQSLARAIMDLEADTPRSMANLGTTRYSIDVSLLEGAHSLTHAPRTGSAASSWLGTLGNETAALSGKLDLGSLSLEHYGFAGSHAAIHNGGLFGVGAGMAIDLPRATFKLAMIQASEQGGVLGMSGDGHFSMPESAALTTVSLSAALDVGKAMTLFGGIERGVATGEAERGYVASVDPLAFSSFQLGLRSEGVLDERDSLTLTASQPLRVENGTMALLVPSGRTAEGDILFTQHRGELEPTGRQVDLGLNYAITPDENSRLEIGAVYSLDFGHVSGASGAAIAASFSSRF
ncbi:S8 family peptidase [Pelagibacterium sp. H642]|uniref:S8 family peptidase n=1 Tax=Pelagibacterium sp. H642 TaxID=1881069 RepID=UPI002815D546|nr:S8 family peptidase [Pelagibacterium sp. H642]WMT92589.1 S8 family serine peptidase [Pelagibacterium sp. H642]